MPGYLAILALVESLAVLLCFYSGVYLRFAGDLEAGAASIGALAPRAAIFASLVMLAMLSVGLYRAHQRVIAGETLFRVVTAFVLAAFANTTLYYIVPGIFTGRGSLALALIIAFFSVLLIRMTFFSVVDSGRFKRNVLIFGRGDVAASFARLCSGLNRCSFRVVGYISAPGDRNGNGNECRPRLSVSGSLQQLVRERRVDEIVVAMDDRRDGFPAEELLNCRLDGIKVSEALTFLEKETGKLDLNTLQPAWLIYGRGFRRSTSYKVVKRIFDVASSMILLAVTLPVLALVSVAILLESGFRGGVLYKQWRIGLNGEPFRILKLRSMIPEAEGDGDARWAMANDPRITRVGTLIRRLRIDELPQIFNILKGEMSFVGPRPERPAFVDELTEKIAFYRERHCVKPGLTGWAQLCYPYGASVEDARQKLQYDLYYLKNHSPVFDLLILLQTLDVIIWRRKHGRSDRAEQSSSAIQKEAA